MVVDAPEASAVSRATRVVTTEAGRVLRTALGFAHRAPDTLGARSIPGHVERGFAMLEKAPWPPDVELLIRIARARCQRQATSTLAPREL
jgi:hypothetical protein